MCKWISVLLEQTHKSSIFLGFRFQEGKELPSAHPIIFPSSTGENSPYLLYYFFFFTLQSLVRRMLNGMCQDQQEIIHYEQKKLFPLYSIKIHI